MKCKICSANIAILYLNKIKGTYIRKNSKLHPVCFECQKKFKDNLKEQV